MPVGVTPEEGVPEPDVLLVLVSTGVVGDVEVSGITAEMESGNVGPTTGLGVETDWVLKVVEPENVPDLVKPLTLT